MTWDELTKFELRHQAMATIDELDELATVAAAAEDYETENDLTAAANALMRVKARLR